MRLELLTPQPGVLELNEASDLRSFFEKISWAAPSFLLNTVATVSADFTGKNGSSRDISNEFDYQALMGYRKAADGILTTARTARTESYRRSKYAHLALVSKSAKFDGIPAVVDVTAGPVDSLVYLLVSRKHYRVVRSLHDWPWIRVVNVGSGSSFRLTFALTRIGWRRILVESGPEFSRWLISKSVIKTIALTIPDAGTISPLNASQEALRALGVVNASLVLSCRVDGTLFTRWEEIVPLQAG